MKDSSKKLYTLFNYVAKTLATISQMCDTVLNDADTRGNGTSLNHKNVIHMGIHATTLFSHVQNVSLCGPKPGYESAMQKPRNIGSKYLLGDDLKKAAKKAKWK